MDFELKQIPSYEKYFATKEGRIFSKWSKDYKELKLTKSCYGYLVVDLCNSDKKIHKQFRVHRVIYNTFVGDIPKDFCIDHIDGDKINNNIENLRLCTNRQNSQFQNKKKNNPTGYVNIYLAEDRKNFKYRVNITISKNEKILKSFLTLEEAIKFRDKIYERYNIKPI